MPIWPIISLHGPTVGISFVPFRPLPRFLFVSAYIYTLRRYICRVPMRSTSTKNQYNKCAQWQMNIYDNCVSRGLLFQLVFRYFFDRTFLSLSLSPLLSWIFISSSICRLCCFTHKSDAMHSLVARTRLGIFMDFWFQYNRLFIWSVGSPVMASVRTSGGDSKKNIRLEARAI